MHMRNLKFTNTQQAAAAYNYKNTKEELCKPMQLYGLTKYVILCSVPELSCWTCVPLC